MEKSLTLVNEKEQIEMKLQGLGIVKGQKILKNIKTIRINKSLIYSTKSEHSNVQSNEEKMEKVIENLIINALETQYQSIQENNYSDMREENIKRNAKNRSKIIELQSAIIKMLPKDGQKMFFELDSLVNANLSIESEYMFKKGAIEGLTSFEYLKQASEYVYLPSLKL